MPSLDPVQLILVRLDLMKGCLTALETSNSSASSHALNTAEAALGTAELPKDKSSAHDTPFATTEENDHSVANEYFTEARTTQKNSIRDPRTPQPVKIVFNTMRYRSSETVHRLGYFQCQCPNNV